MKTYKQFKLENGVENFKFRQSMKTKRWVADCDMPLMVTSKFKGTAEELKSFLNEDVFVSPLISTTGEPVLVICKQGWGDSAEG